MTEHWEHLHTWLKRYISKKDIHRWHHQVDDCLLDKAYKKLNDKDQLSSVTQSCLTLCEHMNSSRLGFPVNHKLLEFIQSHVHWVGDVIQPSHPLLSPSPPVPNLSQHKDLFRWVSASHQVTKVLEFQLQHQSFQWTPRAHFL